MKFRRRVKLFPGVTLNFSKKGISTTIGVKGASININRKGTYLNTGIPGTGIYDRKKLGKDKRSANLSHNLQEQTFPEHDLTQQQVTEFKSTEDAEQTTTEGLQELKTTLLSCLQEKSDLKKEILKARTSLMLSSILLFISYVLIVGFISKWFKASRDDKKEYLDDLEEQLSNCHIDIDFNTDARIEQAFIELQDSYEGILTCQKIWDITSTSRIDKTAARSAASESLTRKQVKFGFGNIDIIKSKYNALHFENANGGDLYIYPAFIIIATSKEKFGLIDIREVEFEFISQKFLEEEGVPSDAKVIGNTWAKVNKNGSPDKRFKDNYQIPVCLYGHIELKSTTGLHEAYCFSDHDKAERFLTSLTNYQNTLLDY